MTTVLATIRFPRVFALGDGHCCNDSVVSAAAAVDDVESMDCGDSYNSTMKIAADTVANYFAVVGSEGRCGVGVSFWMLTPRQCCYYYTSL